MVGRDRTLEEGPPHAAAPEHPLVQEGGGAAPLPWTGRCLAKGGAPWTPAPPGPSPTTPSRDVVVNVNKYMGRPAAAAAATARAIAPKILRGESGGR